MLYVVGQGVLANHLVILAVIAYTDLGAQELDGKLLEPEILRERVRGDVVGCEGSIDPNEERAREDADH
jgi:hypothetical protein